MWFLCVDLSHHCPLQSVIPETKRSKMRDGTEDEFKKDLLDV